MKKNKSIDGLVSRRSKKSATKPTKKSTTTKQTTKRPTTKKAQTKKPLKKTIEVKEFITETTVNPLIESGTITETSATITTESEFISKADATENFLNPVQAFDFTEGDKDLQISKKSKRKTNKKMKEKKKPGKVRKTITTLCLLIVLVLIGSITWLAIWGNDIIAKITGSQGNIFDLLTFTNETYEPLKTDENGRTNILAFGTSGYNMDGDVGYGVHDGAALTDSIMMISLDQETGDVAMLSLPRDLKASPTCTATGKINEVYWCNNQNSDNEQAGAEALMTEVGSILGIDFQYYAHVNWGSLVQIVDTLGGITVTLDEDILDYYYTGADYKAGVPYTLNGDEAHGLARARHGTANGDFSRGASQQKILIGIKDRILEKNFNITDLISLASALGDNLRTNFSIEEIKTAAHLLSGLDLNSARQISLIDPEPLMTTGMINGISYVLPSAGLGNYGKIQKYVAKMTSNDPRIYEEPTILILNGTETDGLASSEKNSLEQEGYTDIDTDNAPEGVYETKYILYALTEKPGTKTLLENRYNTTAKSTNEAPENISQDYDFIIILGD